MRGRGITWVAVFTFSILAAPTAADGDLRLVEAAKSRDVQAVRLLLKQRADPNAPQPDGATALHWAAQWDDLDTAEALLAAGADANVANAYGVTPLSLACTNGSAPMVERLLRAGARPNVALPTGETPLMIAARTGAVVVLKTLVARGADVNEKLTERGQTALMWAAAEGHHGAVRVLLEMGADVNARSSSGYTALLSAARNGDRQTTEVLLGVGARIEEAADDGTTPLLIATLRGHTDYAAFLLDRGAKANVMSAGYSPLHWAAGDWDTEVTSGAADGSEWDNLGGIRGPKKLEFVKLLLARGADPNARITRSPRRFGGGGGNLVGATPFLLAAGAGDVDVMRTLVDAGSDPHAKTAQGTTPLMMAAGLTSIQGVDRVPDANAVAAVRLCLELGADVRAVNELGETSLHGAVYKGSNTIVQLLAERGADVNAADRMQRTPLSLAEGVYRAGAFIILPETVELLLKLGARPGPAADQPPPAATPRR